MPLTSKERMQIYREKLKRNPGSQEIVKAKDRERKRIAKLKRTKMEHIEERIKNRLRVQEHRRQKKIADSKAKWTPQKVELMLWTHYLARGLKPEIMEGMSKPLSNLDMKLEYGEHSEENSNDNGKHAGESSAEKGEHIDENSDPSESIDQSSNQNRELIENSKSNEPIDENSNEPTGENSNEPIDEYSESIDENSNKPIDENSNGPSSDRMSENLKTLSSTDGVKELPSKDTDDSDANTNQQNVRDSADVANEEATNMAVPNGKNLPVEVPAEKICLKQQV